MSESQTAAQDKGAAYANGPGAGAQLRAAREAQGMHIAALAVALKVPVSRLEALEADRFDLLPDPPFVRALAGGVCRALKIDPAPVLAQLPQKVPQRLEAEIHGVAPRFQPPGTRKPGVGEQLSRPVVWSVLFLLVAAGALIMLPTERLGVWVTEARQAIHEHMAAVQAPAEAPAPPVAAVEPAGPQASDTPAATPTTLPSQPLPSSLPPSATPATAASAARPGTVPAAAAPAAASTATAAAPSASTASAAPAAAPAAGESQVVFQSTAESWVKVTDGHGKVVFQKSVAPGSTETVTGAAPLAVVVGKADATQVLVHGQPFDMSTIARSNVARFEVK